MAGFNSSGTYVRTYNWVSDKSNNIVITSTRFDTEYDGFAAGLSNVLCSDGQQTATGAIPFSGGSVKVSNGTVGSASVAFINEGDSGLYRIGSHNLGLALNGTKVWDFGTTTASVAGALVLGTPLLAASGGTGDANAAWANYSATATAGSGTLTASPVTTGKQKAIGKTQFFDLTCTLAGGTGGSPLKLTLPATANTSMVVAGSTTNSNGNVVSLVSGVIAAGGTTVNILLYDGGKVINDGVICKIGGAYEKQ